MEGPLLPELRSNPLLTAVLVACTIWLGSASTARAQLRELPSAIVTKPGALSADEIEQVREFAQSNIELLMSEEPETRLRARRALRDAATAQNASVAFRIEFGKAARGPLAGVVRDGDSQSKLLALHVAGHIGTEPCARIAADALDHDDPIVRYSAALALGLTNRGLLGDDAAITPDQALQLNERLADRIGPETDMWVLDRVVRSLGAAAELTNSRFLPVGIRAMDLLATRLGERLRAAGEPGAVSLEELEAMIRAADTILRSFQRGQRLPPETIRRAAGFGGDALAFVARSLRSQSADDRRLVRLQQLARTGENITFFARSVHPESDEVSVRNLQIASRLVQDRDVQGFLDALDALLGPEGYLTRRPFGFRADRFAF